ncbi:hypothetical protein DFH09DRAFT_1071742 [Mycena vulgaris]|nr:hypothetical protein DFH09DRAFT_1071742 [Mycena vulgaris]
MSRTVLRAVHTSPSDADEWMARYHFCTHLVLAVVGVVPLPNARSPAHIELLSQHNTAAIIQTCFVPDNVLRLRLSTDHDAEADHALEAAIGNDHAIYRLTQSKFEKNAVVILDATQSRYPLDAFPTFRACPNPNYLRKDWSPPARSTLLLI